MTMFIGIDPGASGAIAVFRPPAYIAVFDMPTVQVTISGKSRSRIDHAGLSSIIKDHDGATLATIEEVSAAPGQGVTSMFTFGVAFGAVKQAVASEDVPVQMVRPQEWKAKFKLIGKDKEESRLRASQMFPKSAHLWARKKDDGRAEAVLLAVFGAISKGDFK